MIIVVVLQPWAHRENQGGYERQQEKRLSIVVV